MSEPACPAVECWNPPTVLPGGVPFVGRLILSRGEQWLYECEAECSLDAGTPSGYMFRYRFSDDEFQCALGDVVAWRKL